MFHPAKLCPICGILFRYDIMNLVHIGSTHLVVIQGNLSAALHHLRYGHRPRVLWIDAICINQASVWERNHQVSRMRYIYRQASKVLVWVYDDVSDRDRSSLQKTVTLSEDIRNHIRNHTRNREGDWAFGRFPISSEVVRFCCAPY
jgi:hypothetical protein